MWYNLIQKDMFFMTYDIGIPEILQYRKRLISC